MQVTKSEEYVRTLTIAHLEGAHYPKLQPQGCTYTSNISNNFKRKNRPKWDLIFSELHQDSSLNLGVAHAVVFY